MAARPRFLLRARSPNIENLSSHRIRQLTRNLRQQPAAPVTKGNYRYAFKAGLTDEAGHLTAFYSDLDQRRRESAAENLMDYNTRLDGCDSTIKIVVPSQD
jgi:hypothetical protein